MHAMGVKEFLKNRYNIMFILFMIGYLLLLNHNNIFVLQWDEARHSVQGHLFYDYFRTLLSGEFLSFTEFVSAYGEKGIMPGMGYNIGWYAWFDPPAHAIAQAIVFFIFGPSVWSARFATHLLILFLSPFMYLLATKILGSRKLGLAATIIFFLSYLILYFGRLVILEVPIALLMAGWFYLLFYGTSKTYVIKFTKSIKLRFRWHVFWSALCLTGATMMKYQSLIFAGAFMAVYILFLILQDLKKEKIKQANDIIPVVLKSEGWSLGWMFVFQVAVIFLIGGLWMKASLLDAGMLERMAYEGMGRQRQWSPDYIFSFFIQTFTQTRIAYPFDPQLPPPQLKYIIPSIAWFALIPLFGIHKKNSFIRKNPRLLILLATIYLISTFMITNRQLRYMLHAIPFLAILITQGAYTFASYLEKKRIPYAFTILMIAFIGVSAYTGISLQKMEIANYGVYSDELVRYMKGIDDPKMLLNIKNKVGPEETGYYYNPDLFIFEAMLSNRQHNARTMTQYASYIPWVSIESDHEEFLSQVSLFDDQLKTVVIAFKHDAGGENMVAPLTKKLLEEGFHATELEWYLVFEK